MSTALIIGTTSLRSDFGDDVYDHFARTYSITVVGHVLFDLMLQSKGSLDLTPNEIVQHTEAVIIDDLKLATEENPYFQLSPMKEIVAAFYQLMVRQAWPHLVDHPIRQRSSHVARVNYESMEIFMSRVEKNDGS